LNKETCPNPDAKGGAPGKIAFMILGTLKWVMVTTLLIVSMTGVWTYFHSKNHNDRYCYFPNDDTVIQLQTWSGAVYIERADRTHLGQNNSKFYHGEEPLDYMGPPSGVIKFQKEWLGTGVVHDFEIAGFAYLEGRRLGGLEPEKGYTRYLQFPLWWLTLLAIPFAWVSLSTVHRRVQRRRAKAAGAVPCRCGYDKRATPDCCPECGE
jgi:hypothetical protein